MPSSWLQLSLHTDPAAIDAVSNFLIERGSPGVVINKNEIQAYFAHSADDGLIRKDVQRFLRGINELYSRAHEPPLRWRLLKDRNWNSLWRRFFTPQKIGKSFWVTPPWAAPPRLRNRHVITIEPGMAFGTGTHATTRGCLEFIEEAALGFKGLPFRALDVGTGSGILAIAAAKLGAEEVLALDNDPHALRVAGENLRCNAVQAKVRLSGTNLRQIRKSFLLVVANLTAETIMDLTVPLARRVAPKGFLILSGILTPKGEDVASQFEVRAFKTLRRKRDKEWMTILLRRG